MLTQLYSTYYNTYYKPCGEMFSRIYCNLDTSYNKLVPVSLVLMSVSLHCVLLTLDVQNTVST